MGLDATVYADDDNEIALASVRIGNLDGVVRLRESIRERVPNATMLLNQVLDSAFHCGDSLQKEEVARAKNEVEMLLEQCPNDELVKEFAAGFGRLLNTALQHNRPVSFS
jgi:hypothetical protein